MMKYSNACRMCGASRDSDTSISEMHGVAVCPECKRIEREGFTWCSVGLIAILLACGTLQLLSKHGFVPDHVRNWATPRWWIVWVLVCLMRICFRLNQRRLLNRKK